MSPLKWKRRMSLKFFHWPQTHLINTYIFLYCCVACKSWKITVSQKRNLVFPKEIGWWDRYRLQYITNKEFYRRIGVNDVIKEIIEKKECSKKEDSFIASIIIQLISVKTKEISCLGEFSCKSMCNSWNMSCILFALLVGIFILVKSLILFNWVISIYILS